MLSVTYCSTFHTQMVAQRMQPLNSSETSDIFGTFLPASEEQMRKKARLNNVAL